MSPSSVPEADSGLSNGIHVACTSDNGVKGTHSDGPPKANGSSKDILDSFESHVSPIMEPPASLLKPMCHPLVEEVTQEVNEYFLEHWKFPDARARKAFVNAEFSRVTSLYFPLGKNERIHFACRLLTLLLLIDGEELTPEISLKCLQIIRAMKPLTSRRSSGRYVLCRWLGI